MMRDRLGRANGRSPLLPKEGWTRHQENGAKPPLIERTGWSLTNQPASVSDHPVCGAKVGFAKFFLMPQTPLLKKEGNHRSIPALFPVSTVVLFLLFFATNASAQSNWVGQFLNRYRAPLIDPASRVTPQISDAPWKLMVRDGVLPVSVDDVIRLMLQSNLDVTVNRFAPLSSGYVIDTFLLPFEPTLNLSATVGRSTQPVASQLTAGAGATAFEQLYHRYSI